MTKPIKPYSALYAGRSEHAMLIPFKGGGGASIGIAAIQRGNPTIVTLDSTPSCIAGQYVYLDLDAADTMAAIEGYHKVLNKMAGNKLVLDVDSTAMAAFSDAGTPICQFHCAHDRFGTMTPKKVQGTITNIWTNQANGLTADTTAGNHLPIVTDADAMAATQLAGFRGLAVLACRVYTAAPSSGSMGIINIGTNGTTATYGLSGSFQLQISNNTSPSLLFKWRPKRAGSAGSDQSIGANAAHNITANTSTHIGAILDLRDFSAPYLHYYKDGVIQVSTLLNMTDAVDYPDVSNGLGIGCLISSSDLSLSSKYGTNGTSSRIKDFGWWKSETASMADMIQYIRDMRDYGEPLTMLRG